MLLGYSFCEDVRGEGVYIIGPAFLTIFLHIGSVEKLVSCACLFFCLENF